jgi:hypothetical protein
MSDLGIKEFGVMAPELSLNRVGIEWSGVAGENRKDVVSCGVVHMVVLSFELRVESVQNSPRCILRFFGRFPPRWLKIAGATHHLVSFGSVLGRDVEAPNI